MEFGGWLKNIRKELNLDVRSLANMTGVDSSTISRTENLQTQTTLYTAFRISEGIGISLIDLIDILEEKHLTSLEKNNFIANDNVLTLQNIEKIIEDLAADDTNVIELITSHLNLLLKEGLANRTPDFLFSDLFYYDDNDVYRFLYESPLFYKSDMKYPRNIDYNVLLYSYEHKGALILQDAELYASKVRPNKSRTRLPLNFSPQSRMEAGSSLERIKFSDVLQYDIETEQHGKVLGMYWEACRFYAKFTATQLNSNMTFTYSNLHYKQPTLFDISEIESYTAPREEWVIRLATMILVVYRWYQSLKGNKFVFKMDRQN
jgi:transcriptional regulator with XRE-family HTH domain